MSSINGFRAVFYKIWVPRIPSSGNKSDGTFVEAIPGFHKWEDNAGMFHEWGYSMESGEGGPVAIIETLEGKVLTVDPSNLSFTLPKELLRDQ
jgi:hypothetical protein